MNKTLNLTYLIAFHSPFLWEAREKYFWFFFFFFSVKKWSILLTEKLKALEGTDWKELYFSKLHMRKVLGLFAHPSFEHSEANKH